MKTKDTRLAMKVPIGHEGELISPLEKVKFFNYKLPEVLESGNMTYRMTAERPKDGVRLPYLETKGHLYYKLTLNLLDPHVWTLHCNISKADENYYNKYKDKKKIRYDFHNATLSTIFKQSLSPHFVWSNLDLEINERLRLMRASPHFNGFKKKYNKQFRRGADSWAYRTKLIMRQKEAGIYFNTFDVVNRSKPFCLDLDMSLAVLDFLEGQVIIGRDEAILNQEEFGLADKLKYQADIGSDTQVLKRFRAAKNVVAENPRIFNFLYNNIEVAPPFYTKEQLEAEGYKRWSFDEILMYAEARSLDWALIDGDYYKQPGKRKHLNHMINAALYIMTPGNYFKASSWKVPEGRVARPRASILGSKSTVKEVYARLKNRVIQPNQLIKVGILSDDLVRIGRPEGVKVSAKQPEAKPEKVKKELKVFTAYDDKTLSNERQLKEYNTDLFARGKLEAGQIAELIFALKKEPSFYALFLSPLDENQGKDGYNWDELLKVFIFRTLTDKYKRDISYNQLVKDSLLTNNIISEK